MNIAWYTPFSAHSAIGRFSRLVVQAMRSAGAEVQIVRSETKTSMLRGVTAAAADENCVWASDWHRHIAKHLSQYDLVVYNVGDHYDNHIYCFEHQPIVPGITILHDCCLHHALHHHCLRTGSVTGAYREQVASECGPSASHIYDRLLETGCSQLWWHHELARFPIFRWAMRDTLGIVTHAEFYRETVAKRIGCPAVTIPLAYDTPLASTCSTKPTDDKLTILTIGAVNANKRYEAVIRALAESPLLRAALSVSYCRSGRHSATTDDQLIP